MATTTNNGNNNEIDAILQFLNVNDWNRQVEINQEYDFTSEDYRQEGFLDEVNSILNRDDPIKYLELAWDDREVENNNNDNNHNIHSNMNNIWGLKNIEILGLDRFPYASFTATSTETSINPPNYHNNDNDNSISIGKLAKTLKYLVIADCRNNTFHLPRDIGMLVNLTELGLVDIEHLTCLPCEIGQLQSLQKLKITACDSLITIPNEIGNITTLKKLKIVKCRHLKYLPKIGMNNLSKNLQSLKLYDNDRLRPTTTEFSFDIRHFIKLRELEIGWNDYSYASSSSSSSSLSRVEEGEEGGRGEKIGMILLRNLPTISFERLILNNFNDEYLSILTGHTTTTTTTTTSPTTETTANTSSLLHLLPRNIKEVYIKDSIIDHVPNSKINQDAIHTLLDAFPRLSIHFKSYKHITGLRGEKESLGLFTNKLVFLMCFNRCGRILTKNFPSSSLSPALPLSMWPMVLEDVRKRIGCLQNKQIEQIIQASVIFSFLQGPAFMSRSVVDSNV